MGHYWRALQDNGSGGGVGGKDTGKGPERPEAGLILPLGLSVRTLGKVA
jgi:hypothetical protein